MRNALFVAVVLLLFLAFSSGPAQSTEWFHERSEPSETPRVILTAASHTPHSPITISSNEDFSSQGWPGNGAEANPYLIENLGITSADICMNISDTTVFFEIGNCYVSSSISSSDIGIRLDNVTHCSVHDCVVELHGEGIYLVSSPNCTLTSNYAATESLDFSFDFSDDCTLTNNTAISYTATSDTIGFRVGSSSRCTMTRNAAAGNLIGILLESSNCTLTNNRLYENGLVIECRDLSGWLQSIDSNTVNTRPLGYIVNATGTVVHGEQYGQLILVNCSRVTVNNGAFRDASCGVELAFCTDCRLTNNTATGNRLHGFDIFYSHNSTLTNNTAASNSDGFVLLDSSYCVLTRNNAADNAHYGFRLSNCYGCTLFLNRIGPNGMANAFDDGLLNTWDDGVSQGNYWSDYSGFGVYPIIGGAGSVDRFPLSDFPRWGQMVLIVAVVGAVAVLITLLVHFRKRHTRG